MTELIQEIVNGVALGSIYALLAVALSLVFGVLEIPQFALGGHAMIGAYVCYLCTPHTGFWLALVIVAGATAVLGILVQGVVFDPLRAAPQSSMFIAAFGLLLVLEGTAQVVFGPNIQIVNFPWMGGFVVGGAHVTFYDVVIVVAVALAFFALRDFLQRTRLGRQIRATGQNQTGALVVGISTRRIGFITMAIGSALAGIAGALLAPLSDVFPTVGDAVLIQAFIIIVLAGMGSIVGALIGGYTIGLLVSLGGAYVSQDYSSAFPVLLLLLVLIFRPEGFANRSKTRV